MIKQINSYSFYPPATANQPRMAKYLTDEGSNYRSLSKKLRPDDSPSDVEAIVFSMALPSEAEIIRYAGASSGNPTSAKTLMQDVKLNWQNVTLDGNIPAAEQMVFLFRNPLRSFVFYDANPTGRTFDYIIHLNDGSTAYNQISQLGGDFYQPQLSYGTDAGASQYLPHGDYVFPCEHQGRYGYWCDNDGKGGDNSIHVIFDADPTVGGAIIDWYIWNGAIWEMVNADVAVALQLDYHSGPPVGGAYMSFDIKIVAAAAANFTVHLKTTPAQAGGCWCHRTIPNISELLPIINGVRVNAASLLWTNFSSELEASGKIVSVSVAPCLPWSNIAISQSNLTKLQGYESRQAKTGYYGFLKPDGPGDFEMHDDIRQLAFRGSTATFGSYPVIERYSYIAVALSVANTNARDTSIQVTHAVEYLTNSKIQEVQDPPYSSVAWAQAIEALRKVDQHHENKFHFKKILRGIGKIGKKVFQVGSAIAHAVPLPMFQGAAKVFDMEEDMGATRLLDGMSNIGRKRVAAD